MDKLTEDPRNYRPLVALLSLGIKKDIYFSAKHVWQQEQEIFGATILTKNEVYNYYAMERHLDSFVDRGLVQKVKIISARDAQYIGYRANLSAIPAVQKANLPLPELKFE